MSGLCGWFAGNVTAAEAPALIARMAARVPRLADAVVRQHTSARLAIAVSGPRGEADLFVENDIVAAIHGRPRWVGEYADIAKQRGNAAALAAAFTRLGRRVFDVIHGHVAVFAADAAGGRAVAAVDRVGVNRLCYHASPGAPFVFGATTHAVGTFPGVPSDLDPQALFDYLYFNKIPAPTTIWRDQKKLLAAEYLWHENGATTTGFYWQMPFEQADRRDKAALGAELREIVSRAVERSHDDVASTSVGTFLSGGLDSSTVTGMFTRSAGSDAKAFSIGFNEERYDERPYARLTARHFGTRLHEYVVTPNDLMDVIPRMAEAYDEPFCNSSALLVYCCAKLARECGVELMLAGDGGDEIFGGNSRYVYQKQLETYQSVPLWFRSFALEPAVRAVPFGRRLPLFRKVRGYVDKATIPLPERLQLDNFYASAPVARIMSPELIAHVDARHPVWLMEGPYERAPSKSTMQRLFALDVQLTLADEDLRKVSTMCEVAGVNVRYPLIDDEVTEFAAHIPAEVCIPGFKLRQFYKDAFRGFLPDATLNKSKHGFGMPFEWFVTDRPLRTMINDSLTALKRRHLFNEAFLDEAISGRSPELEAASHDVHFALMMVELWLDRHTV